MNFQIILTKSKILRKYNFKKSILFYFRNDRLHEIILSSYLNLEIKNKSTEDYVKSIFQLTSFKENSLMMYINIIRKQNNNISIRENFLLFLLF